VRVKISIKGIVQGVGFRPFTYRYAVKNDLNGYIQNRGDAGVEIILEGEKHNINNFIKDLKKYKPPQAQIYDMIIKPLRGKNLYEAFTIFKSSNKIELSGSVIPPDIAICYKCLKELRNPTDPRHNYFFITCTDCGPRYTIIKNIPYDRENTTMLDFRMMKLCSSEYQDPGNRRFHSQTVACPKCGPKAYLTYKNGETTDYKDPIRKTGKLISEGYLVAIKGYGGFHIASSTVIDQPLIRLRQAKYRRQKPFAVMAPSLDTIKTFAEINKKEEEIITSYSRPIVLLKKIKSYPLLETVAPKLHNIGVMLPYTGLHYMLFDQVDDKAFVMTSANPPNQPILMDNHKALKKLGGIVDFFLFHERQIAHRCDDSVVRIHDNNKIFLRRSRGYAPTPIVLNEKSKNCVIALGGELNNTSCILLDNKAFLSQHIGDVENVETRNFMQNSSLHLLRLTNSKVESVACDQHPKFVTTHLARELANERGWRLIKVQHHYAHIASLMFEHEVNEIIGICCDGYGYGYDGEAWGGEILFLSKDTSGFKRLAHLQKQPLIGGDLATRYPLRIVAGILHKKIDLEKWIQNYKEIFPYKEREIQVILNQLNKNFNSIKTTTSCGRVLDGVASLLDICYERTYEGEPAIKLESLASKGRDILKIEPIIKNNILNTTEMLFEIFNNKANISNANLAVSAHMYLAKGLAMLALEKANQKGVKTIGFSGGVACNKLLTIEIKKIIESYGLRFLTHEFVPPGDGGISFGQAVVAGFLSNHN
jgi:hydrogenase maturation protein HypF